jgi:site-specific DNA recombinase
MVACQRKINEIGAQVVAVYEDAGVSGALLLARPGMQSALRDIEEGRADTLIIANLSRYSRDREHQSVIKKRVVAAGARLVFCDMHFEDTPEGDLAFNIMGDFAAYERALIRQRSMTGKLRRIEEGIQPSRAMRPFGYHIVTERDVIAGHYPTEELGKYHVIEEEAAWVRGIFQRYAAGASMRSVARWLQENGVPTHRGASHWAPQTVKGILCNPVYKGLATFGKRERRVDETRLQNGFRRADYNPRVSKERWRYLPAPAILDEKTWDTCQARMAENRELLCGNPTRRYMLSGLLRCPGCHRSMNAKKCGRGYAHYHCKDYAACQNPQERVCHNKFYNAPVLERRVIDGLMEVARRPEMIEAALRAYARRVTATCPTQELERLRKELAALEAEERATVQAQIAGIRSGARTAVYEKLLAEIAQKRAPVETQITRLQRDERTTAAPDPPSEAVKAARMLASLEKVLTAPELSGAVKHDLLAGVIQAIRPKDEDLVIELRPLPGPEQIDKFIVIRRAGNE